jgi:hypothetical protein
LASLLERKFVFLSPEDKGYEIAIGKTPKGHIEIERKDDRLSFKVFVENLKEMVYQIQLFTNEGRYVVLEEISVGRSGKQEGKYSTSSLDVLNSGISWQEFDVVVIRPLGLEHSRKVPLVAWLKNTKGTRGQVPYISEEVNHELIENEIKDEKEIQIGFRVEDQFSEELEEKIEEKMKEEEIEQEYVEEQKEEQEIHATKQKEDPYSKLEEYWVNLDRENKEENLEQEIEEVEHGVEPEVEPEAPYYYINRNIEQLEKAVPEIKPFRPPIKNHRWWKIMKDQKDLEGFYLYYNGSFVNLTYPYMGYRNIGEVYVEEYNHMIFGIVFDENIEKKPSYYVYGIPGRLCMQDQPFQGNTGFLYWHPAQGNSKEKGAMGYWLLYVEAHSGVIAVPKRPTIAPVCDN